VTATLVDSNVLIDVATRDPRWFSWSSDELAAAADLGRVVLNQIVFAEVGAGYRDLSTLERALAEVMLERVNLPWSAAHLAGQRHRDYRRAGGLRERTLPDFLVGAHAETADLRLLTRDPRVYRRWFPAVALISPAGL
jgi:predicted nucleic acid-binding protein